MNPERAGSDVTRDGVRGARPARDALTGARRRGRAGGERPMVERARFTSYYGRPVLKAPTWQARDIAGYLFLGGLAGASAPLAALAHATGRARLSLAAKLSALVAILASLAALVHDLGRPSRFLHMLRVCKPTSPMSIGTWLLSAFAPLSAAAAASALTGRLPRAGATATAGAAALGPAVAAYTAVLISDTAVPAWHDGYREMPFVFVGSGAAAAGGLGLLAAPSDQAGPARALAVLGAGTELTAFELMRRRLGPVAEPYSTGRGGRYVRASTVLTAAAAVTAVAGSRSRVASAAAGAAFLAASAATRWGIFHAGVASAEDPRYTIEPQRRRVEQRS